MRNRGMRLASNIKMLAVASALAATAAFAAERPRARDLGIAPGEPAALTPRTLLTALRLAASLGGQAAVTAALRPGALTLLRGIPAEVRAAPTWSRGRR